MSLKALAKKLRQAANILDDLLYESGNENQTTASEIVKRHTRKPKFRYHGTHWTQLPKNKAKLRKMVKASAKARKESKS